uniref:Ankyrin repeat domain 6b n=1 Tax=Petromyzon marinus TaxID=7757 RepID=S4RP33_PETMA
MSGRDGVDLLAEKLLVAAHRGRVGDVVELINRGAPSAINKHGRSPLHLAASRGHAEVVRLLASAGCNLDLQDDGGQTALHRAVEAGSTAVLSVLLDEGCSLDRQDTNCLTLAHDCSTRGYKVPVCVCVQSSINILFNKAGSTPLHLACQNGHSQSCRGLLLGGSRPDAKNHMGDTCTHIAARYNHVTVVRILISAFCSVDEKNELGDTALHVTAQLNHRKVTRLLLAAGANPTPKNNAELTPLDVAREHDNADVALLLSRAPHAASVVPRRRSGKEREPPAQQRRSRSVPRNHKVCGASQATATLPSLSHVPDSSHSRHSRRHHHSRRPASDTERDSQEGNAGQLLASLIHLHSRGKQTAIDERMIRSLHVVYRLNRYIGPASPPPPTQRAYQLYTLYRDREGKLKQAALNGCRCDPLIQRVDGKMEATREELMAEIDCVKDRVNARLGEVESRTKHQLLRINKLTKERVAAEGTKCLHRIDQRAVAERRDVLAQQEAVSQEIRTDLQAWCLEKIQAMESRLRDGSPRPEPREKPADRQSYDTSVGQALNGSASARQEEATGTSMIDAFAPSPSHSRSTSFSASASADRQESQQGGDGGGAGAGGSRGFYLSLQHSPTAPPSLRHGASPTAELAAPVVAVEPAYAFEHGAQGPAVLEPGGGAARRSPELVALGLGDAPGARDALQVTRCFLDAVSSHLEGWYLRRVEEERAEVARRAMQDRAEMQAQIRTLEEQLRAMKTQAGARG